MKSVIAALTLSLGVLFVILGPGVSPGLAAAASPVSVQFVNPGKFTDFQIRGRDVNYTTGVFANSVWGAVVGNYNNINATPTITVGTSAASKRPSGEIPASPNREARML